MKCIVAAVAFCLAGTGAQAQQILALAVSPDGTQVVMAGDNRTVYLVDTDKMKVTGRRYYAEMVEDLAFGPDGSRLYLRDSENRLTAVDSGKFKPLWSQADVSEMVPLPGAGVIVGLESRWNGAAVNLIDAETGAATARIDLGEVKGKYLAVDDAATRAVVLTGYERSDTEPNENPPSDLKGVAKADFRQRHDGYVSTVIDVDLASGGFQTAETFFRASFLAEARMMGDKALFLGGPQDTALVGPDGATEMVDLGEDYFSMAQTTRDGTTYILTNGSRIAFRPVDPAATSTLPELDAGSVNGPAERVTAIAEAADGTLYFGTSAYRLLRVAPDRGTVTAHPVY